MLDKVFSPNDVERKWNKAWSESAVFTARTGSEQRPFCIIQPPPNVTGTLTVGHALGTTVQDLLCRWQRLKGCNVLWLPGIDHAGIATQKVVERHLEERGLSKDELGRDKFVEQCWRWKERHHRWIIEQETRLGASLDWTREVFTLDPGVSRAVREVFVRLYNRGLIYRDRYIVNWCPSCRTALSDEEVVFRQHRGKLYHIAYPFVDGSGEVVVGTTRPETMLGDVAVAINPAHERSGELEGKRVILPLTGRTIPVILDEAVDPEFGTGYLKVTPAHDPTDFQIGLRHRLEPFIVMDREGKMNEAAGEFAGLSASEAREKVLVALEREGLLRTVEDYEHSIGHHDRCDTMIEPSVSLQWFLSTKSLAGPGLAVVRDGDVVFLPERWKNIYIDWMENIRDWCISRQLWWGHRIPVWYCSECNEVIASVDEPSACTSCGSRKLVQDDDVLDTWFSSWLWTFSPMGWPEMTEDLEMFHPTDVLVTGGDIIFFWVARMIMAALEFMGEIPFSTVYITGIVRDAHGRKMSKSLGNSPEFIDIIERYGADAFRFMLINTSPPGQDLLFDETKVEAGRHLVNKIWNAARFVLGQESGGFFGGTECGDPITDLFRSLYGAAPREGVEFGWEERWITGRLSAKAAEYGGHIDSFRFDEASRTMYDFFWHEYCDWYLELSKPAFRAGGARARGAAVAARTVLGYSMILLHPIMPFVTEEIWSMLSPDAPLLAGFRFPGVPRELSDPGLEQDVQLFREIVTSIRNIRHTFNVPLEQKVSAIINCAPGLSIPERLLAFEGQIRLLARVEDLTVAENAAKPESSAAAGLSSVEIYVPLRGVIDLDVERRRLQQDLGKTREQCEKVGERLRDDRFLQRAPADVVEREKSRFRDMSERMRRIERILEDLL